MHIARQFEKRGPLWLPRYVPDGTYPRYTPEFPGRGLPRFERWRRRSTPPGADRKRFRCGWTHANGVAGGSSSTGSSYTLTLGFTPSAGTLLTVAAATSSTATSAMSISDNSSGPADSWSATTSMGSWYYGKAQSWACNVTTGTAPTSITITATGNTGYIYVGVDNYSGGPNPFVQDGSGVQNAVNSTTNPTASFTTGSQAGDLLWACEITSISQSTVTVGSPFTLRSQGDGNRVNTSDDGTSSSLSASTQYTVTYSISTSTNTITFLIGFQASTAFQPDEDLWQWNGQAPPDNPVTVFG